MYKYGNRDQGMLLPQYINDYVSADDPVRAYDAFVENLDFKELGIVIDPNKVGNSAYDPVAMLKLLVYGYSYGIRSSRKLERATYHNLSFIWLLGGLNPDYKTIAEFRRMNKPALKKVLKQCARLCIDLGLIAGNTLFVDGSKFRADAARGKNYSRKHYEKQLAKIDEQIEKLLAESEAADATESNQESIVKMSETLADANTLKDKINSSIRKFSDKKAETGIEPKTINRTDPESALMHSVHGSHASYNVQAVTDDLHGLIVCAEPTDATSDVNQFAKAIERAQEVTQKQCDNASADAGYADTEELGKIDATGSKVIVPSQRQALHGEEKPFAKSAFKYDKEQDCYLCPEGQRLNYAYKQSENKLAYIVSNAIICHECKNYGVCTESKSGRKIVRLVNEELKEKLERQYLEPSSQEIYARRKCKAELPFGHIKHNLGMRSFLLRGQEGAAAETSLAFSCFNIVRMITILGGVALFAAKMAALRA